MSAHTLVLDGARVGAFDRAHDALPPSRSLTVAAADGTALHTEIFGPPDGYPIVLTHGIVCAIRSWAYQIAHLATEYRVIAFDHRGHGRSGVPRRGGYSLEHLASDLDAVLEATVAPHERAVLAGHSMGGIAIAAWSQHYRDKVRQRADAVALINTTTGDLLREVKLLSVPREFSPVRVMAGRGLIDIFGGFPIPGVARMATRSVVAMLAVAAEADPSAAELIYELFVQTSPRGRGGCAKMLVDSLQSAPPQLGRSDGADPGDRKRTRSADADQPVAQDRAYCSPRRGSCRTARRPLLDARTAPRGEPPPAGARRIGGTVRRGAADQLIAAPRFRRLPAGRT